MLTKKILLLLGFVFVWAFVCAPSCFAITLLAEQEALKTVFPEADSTVPEIKTVSDTKFDVIKEKLGGAFYHHSKDGKVEDLISPRDFTFYFASKDNQKTGVAIILTEPGKWGPIQFMVALDLSGKVTRVVVMSYREVRGRPIAGNSFLSQFTGKTLKDPLSVGKDITGVSGATISSTAAAFTVKKAMILYNDLWLQ